MKESTAEGYASTQFAKLLNVGENKQGKTATMVAGLLGVLPWQTSGGVVDRPSSLHVITFDANALGGIQGFLTKTCGAPKEALQLHVLNMQDDFRKASAGSDAYDGAFYGALFDAIQRCHDKAGSGVHAVVFSSLTGVAAGLLRAISGPPSSGKSNMDQNKWSLYGSQLAELQNFAQQDFLHTIWEAHLMKKVSNSKDEKGQPEEKDSIQVKGSMGASWGYNVEQIVRFRRSVGRKHPGSNCDLAYFDTRASLDFLAGGRAFTEVLQPQEPCITQMFRKLGLKTGNWGAPAKLAAPIKLQPGRALGGARPVTHSQGTKQ